MIDWMALASTLAAFFIVAVSPGPATLAVSTISADAGRRSGLTFGTGLSVGLGADDSLANVVVATLRCALIRLLIYAAYAVAFSLSAVMHGYQRFRHWVDGMVSALFAVAGITLLRSAITRN